MIAIVCHSPFQLLIALNLVYSVFNEPCTLFCVRDMWKSEQKFQVALPKFGLVKAVYYLSNYNHKIFHIPVYNRFTVPLLPKVIIRKIIRKRIINYIPGLKYDKIISVPGVEVDTFCIHGLCGDKNTKIYLVEEGLSEYCASGSTKHPHFASLSKDIVCHYFMEPSLLMAEPTYPACKLSPLSQDLEFIETVNEVFGYVPEYLTKFICFGQPFTDYDVPSMKNKFQDRFKKILMYLINRVGSNDFCYKPHPREMVYPFENMKIIKSHVPFELYLLNTNIENNVLISLNSTVLLSPKLLLDKEPYVICLHRLFSDIIVENSKEYEEYDSILDIMNKVKAMYRNPEKFIIPSTMDELDKWVKMVLISIK